MSTRDCEIRSGLACPGQKTSQNHFLALLGLDVIGSTPYRIFVEQESKTLFMGGFAVVAFAVSVVG